jgi:hypothetical protein
VAKTVVKVQMLDRSAKIYTREGEAHSQPITEQLLHKMRGLTTAYFYARPNTTGFKLERLAPFSAWTEAVTS